MISDQDSEYRIMKEFGKFARYCGAVLGIAVVMIACAFLAIVVTP